MSGSRLPDGCLESIPAGNSMLEEAVHVVEGSSPYLSEVFSDCLNSVAFTVTVDTERNRVEALVPWLMVFLYICE